MLYTGGGILVRGDVGDLGSAARRVGYAGDPGRMALTSAEVRHPCIAAIARLSRGVEINDLERALSILEDPRGEDAVAFTDAFPDCLVAAWALVADGSRYGVAVFGPEGVRRHKWGGEQGVVANEGPPLPGEDEPLEGEALVDEVMSRLSGTDFRAWRDDDTPRFHELSLHEPTLEVALGVPSVIARLTATPLDVVGHGGTRVRSLGPARRSAAGDVVQDLHVARFADGRVCQVREATVLLVPAHHLEPPARAAMFLSALRAALRDTLPDVVADLVPQDLAPVALLDSPSLGSEDAFRAAIARHLAALDER